jgi:hypothetical protein
MTRNAKASVRKIRSIIPVPISSSPSEPMQCNRMKYDYVVAMINEQRVYVVRPLTKFAQDRSPTRVWGCCWDGGARPRNPFYTGGQKMNPRSRRRCLCPSATCRPRAPPSTLILGRLFQRFGAVLFELFAYRGFQLGNVRDLQCSQHRPQRFLRSPGAKTLSDLFVVAALRGSPRRSLGPRTVRNSCLTRAVRRICPAFAHLLAHFLACLFAPGLAKRPTNFAAHAVSRAR